MKKMFAALFCATAVMAAPPAPYPFTVDSQSQTVPALEAYQAAAKTFRVRFRDGQAATDLSGAIPWMSWATGTTATGYYTSAAPVIVSSTGGVVDFTFSAQSLNWSNGISGIYAVGFTDSNASYSIVRQGIFTIKASAFGAGVPFPQATSNIDCSAYTFLNPPWAAYTNAGYSKAESDAKYATNKYTESVTPANIAAWNAAGTAVDTNALIAMDSALALYTNRAAGSLQSNVWAFAESTTGYAPRVSWQSTNAGIQAQIDNIIGSTGGIAALAYTNRAALALASSVWAAAQSAEIETNNVLAARIAGNAANDVLISNSLAAEVSARIAADTNKVYKTGDTMSRSLSNEQSFVVTDIHGNTTLDNNGIRWGGYYPITLSAGGNEIELKARILNGPWSVLNNGTWPLTGMVYRTEYNASTSALWGAVATNTLRNLDSLTLYSTNGLGSELLTGLAPGGSVFGNSGVWVLNDGLSGTLTLSNALAAKLGAYHFVYTISAASTGSAFTTWGGATNILSWTTPGAYSFDLWPVKTNSLMISLASIKGQFTLAPSMKQATGTNYLRVAGPGTFERTVYAPTGSFSHAVEAPNITALGQQIAALNVTSLYDVATEVAEDVFSVEISDVLEDYPRWDQALAYFAWAPTSKTVNSVARWNGTNWESSIPVWIETNYAAGDVLPALDVSATTNPPAAWTQDYRVVSVIYTNTDGVLTNGTALSVLINTNAAAGGGSADCGATGVVVNSSVTQATYNAETRQLTIDINPAGAESDPIWNAASASLSNGIINASNLAVTAQTTGEVAHVRALQAQQLASNIASTYVSTEVDPHAWTSIWFDATSPSNYFALDGRCLRYCNTNSSGGGGAESDTLQTVVDRGNAATNDIAVRGILAATTRVTFTSQTLGEYTHVEVGCPLGPTNYDVPSIRLQCFPRTTDNYYHWDDIVIGNHRRSYGTGEGSILIGNEPGTDWTEVGSYSVYIGNSRYSWLGGFTIGNSSFGALGAAQVGNSSVGIGQHCTVGDYAQGIGQDIYVAAHSIGIGADYSTHTIVDVCGVGIGGAVYCSSYAVAVGYGTYSKSESVSIGYAVSNQIDNSTLLGASPDYSYGIRADDTNNLYFYRGNPNSENCVTGKCAITW